MLAGIAVGAGIILERPKYSLAVHAVAFWMIVSGVAIESLCTTLLFVVDERISNAQQSEIVVLLKAALPRNISGDDVRKIADATGHFPGTKYDLSIPPMVNGPYSTDLLESGSNLIWQLITALRRGDWALKSIQGDVPKAELPWPIAAAAIDPATVPEGKSVPVPVILVGQISGVIGVKIGYRFTERPGVHDEIGALLNALNDIGIRTDREFETDGDNMAPNTVHIKIGIKP